MLNINSQAGIAKIKIPLFVIFFFLSLCSFAATIHVAKTGTNALFGRGSSSKPYRTISYLFINKLVKPGDVIVVRGGVYRETVNVNVNNVRIEPYRSEKVTISGADQYGSKAWKADAKRRGVYRLTLTSNEVETDFTQLFVNGQHEQIARFPNNTSSYKNYLSGRNREMMRPLNQNTGFAVLLDGRKPAGNNQTGSVTFSQHNGTPVLPNVTFTDEAIVRGFIGKLRNNIFSYSQDGGQVRRAGNRRVTFKSFNTQGNAWGQSAAYSVPEGFGYIMDLSVLDIAGEWFYKRKANTLYYKPTGGTMSGKNFEVRKRKYALRVSANNVSISDIDFTAGEVELKNAASTEFTRCSFTYMTPFHYRRNYGVFRQGIVLNNADNTSFQSCYIGHTWGSGIIILKGSDNSTINNCVIEDIGWMGQFTISLENNGSNTEITNNTFGSSSRFHIRTTESVFARITDNDFYDAMAMGEDAGSIMFTSTGKPAALDMKGTIIAYNRIHDMEGIPAYDTKPRYNRQKVVGLYLEDVDNYTVHHNLVYNIKGEVYVSKRVNGNGTPVVTQGKADALYLGPRTKSLTKRISYYNNTFWNYDYFLTFWQLGGGRITNLRLRNNILMDGKPSTVGRVTERELSDFVKEVSKAPTNYRIVLTNNVKVANASQHFINAGKGDFRLKAGSSFNRGGSKIPNITSGANPALGASEGNTNSKRNRVFNAGASLTRATFNSNRGRSTDDNVLINLEDNDAPVISNSVYPNPFTDRIQVSLGSDVSVSRPALIYLRNINGGVVMNESTGENQVIEFNTSALSPGIYFLEINHGGEKVIQKIVK